MNLVARADALFEAFRMYDEALTEATEHLDPKQRWTTAPRLDDLYEKLVAAAHAYRVARRGDA